MTEPDLDQLRGELLEHPLYREVRGLPELRVFMESHAFAVWDFMSLLKRLQADLCPARVPWRPPADVAAARFVNEIVLAEESDLDPDGRPAGHLDIYLGAMDEVGADTSGFRSFLAKLAMGRSVEESLNAIRARGPVRRFVTSTLAVAREGSTVEVAAAFLHGREDPIPAMFGRLLGTLAEEGLEARLFTFYLERHVELDGDSHGPLGQELLQRLVGGDELQARIAERAARRAIQARIEFWDGLRGELRAAGGEEYRRLMGV